MLYSSTTQNKIDKVIILPAVVLFIQSVPWFAARIRMRILVPLMLLYVSYNVFGTHSKRFATRKEEKAATYMLVSAVIFFMITLVTQSVAYKQFANGWWVCSVFGLFYMWVYVTLVNGNKIKEIRVLTIVGLAALFLSSVSGASYLAGEDNQTIIREMTGGSADVWDARDAVLSGVGSFGFVYSVGMLAPAIIYAGLRSKSRPRIAFLVGGFTMLLYAYRANFVILLITIACGCSWYGLSFFIRYIRNYRMTIISSIGFILIVTLYPKIGAFVVSPAVYLSKVVGNENYSTRLLSIAASVSGGTDDYALLRSGLMWKSWRVFLSHPFSGVGTSYSIGLLGGHSFFFDFLALGGIFGFFIPYLFFLYCYRQYISLVVFPLSRSSNVMITTYIFMYFLCTFLNPLNSATVWASLFLVLPGVSLWLSDSQLRRRQPLKTNYDMDNLYGKPTP